VAAYTLLQLFEVALASAILLIGVLTRSATVALLGGGLLIAKAILNILWPEGGSVYRRSDRVLGRGDLLARGHHRLPLRRLRPFHPFMVRVTRVVYAGSGRVRLPILS